MRSLHMIIILTIRMRIVDGPSRNLESAIVLSRIAWALPVDLGQQAVQRPEVAAGHADNRRDDSGSATPAGGECS